MFVAAFILTGLAALWAGLGLWLICCERRAPRVICANCGTRFEPTLDDARCPLCGEPDVPCEDDIEMARRLVG